MEPYLDRAGPCLDPAALQWSYRLHGAHCPAWCVLRSWYSRISDISIARSVVLNFWNSTVRREFLNSRRREPAGGETGGPEPRKSEAVKVRAELGLRCGGPKIWRNISFSRLNSRVLSSLGSYVVKPRRPPGYAQDDQPRTLGGTCLLNRGTFPRKDRSKEGQSSWNCGWDKEVKGRNFGQFGRRAVPGMGGPRRGHPEIIMTHTVKPTPHPEPLFVLQKSSCSVPGRTVKES